MSSPELSVLMAVYNSEIFAGEAINSVLQQSFTDFELIIIDDGSTDKTAGIVSSFSDKRIRFIQNEANRGIAHTRNMLLEMAKGEFITFMDDDDTIHPLKFEKQVDFLRKNPGFGLAGSSVIITDESGDEKQRLKLGARPVYIPAIMLFRNYFVNSAVMFRRNLTLGFTYPPGIWFGEDYLLWWKIIQQSQAINLPDYLTCYRKHPGSMTNRMATNRKTQDKMVYGLIFNDIGLDANDMEFELHRAFAEFNPVHSIVQLKQMFAWLKKISCYSHAPGMKKLGPVIRNRWLKTCYKSRGNPFLLIYGLSLFLLEFRVFFLLKRQPCQ